MEAAFSQKSDAKKQHSLTPESLAEASFSRETEQGATAGMPLFLRRLPVSPKLVVGQPNDPLEQEADRVAEMVQSGSHQSAKTASTEADSVQRKCAKCEEEEEEKVQAKSIGTTPAASSSLPLPDAGSALSEEVRSRVEPVLGTDLSHVRVHNSPSAQATAKDLNAKAFTHKNHIWLGANQSPNDIALLSHEATHVVQQTGQENESPLVQRVVVDPAVEDGAEVQRRLRQRIDEALGTRSPTPAPAPNNTPNAATPANAPATVDPETRRAAQQVDRSELAAKTTEVQPDARPSVDRAAEQQPQVEAAAKTTEESLDKPPEEKAEGEGKEAGQGEKKGGAEKAAVAAANQAASIADQAFSMADSQSLPDRPAQVVPPTPIAPVDAGGMPLPDHPEMDEQLFALANQAQELREQGQNQRAHATEGTANTQILRGNLQLVQQSIGQSESGVQKAQGHLEFRRGLLNQAQQALTVSEQKAANLTQQAPEGVSQAASGKEKSGSLASESRDLAGQNNANTPDDPEAAQKSQEQGSKLNQVGSDAASIDDTLTQVHTASNTLVQDAAHATQVNTQTRGRVAGMEATLQQTDASLSAMQEQNSQARSQLDAVQEQPALLKAEATGMDAEGQDMIATSLDIEARIHQAQQNHAAGMQTVPAVEQPQEEVQAIPAEEASEPQAIETPPVAEESVATVLEPPVSAAMQVPETELMPAESAASQEAAIPEPETSPVTEPASAVMQVPETELMSAESAPGEEVIIQRQVATTTASPQAEAAPPQPANINIARGLPSWVTGEPEPNAAERQAAQEQEEARRQQEIDEINAIANDRGGFDRLTAAERRSIAFRLAMRNTFGGISNISWPGLGGIARGAGHLAAGLIDPRAPLMGVVSGVNMIINGVVNFGRQPSWIGALRLAANVATGLTIILGSITAVAGVIAALMTAITIVTLGTAAPFTGPIIAFCATIMSTVGGWTFWVGLIAAALQALTFVADLWQAGTAQTADQLQQQSETMTEDARNAGNSLLQAGMGKLAQVGGRAMQSQISAAGGGVRFAARLGAKAQVGVRALPSRIASGAKALPSRIIGGARSLGTRAISGAKALPSRIIGGVRSLGTRAISGAKALPSRIIGGARSLGTRAISGAKALPSRIVSGTKALFEKIREWKGFDRDFLLGEGIPKGSLRTAPRRLWAATQQGRQGVFLEQMLADLRTGGGSVSQESLNRFMAGIPEIRGATSENIRSLAANTLGVDSEGLMIKGVKDLAAEGATGVSGAPVFIVMDEGGTSLGVIKVFPKTGEFADELSAIQRLGSEGLESMGTPRILGTSRTATEGVMMTTVAPGQTVDNLMLNVGRLSGDVRAAAFRDLRGAVSRNAEALAELRTAPLGSGGAVSSDFIRGHVRAVSEITTKLEEAIERGAISRALLDGKKLSTGVNDLIQGYERNPGGSSLVHGDAHPGNFFYDPKRGITAIDTPTLGRSISPEGFPIGSAARDFANFEQKLANFGSRYGLLPREIEELQTAFRQSYQAASGTQMTTQMTDEAVRFFRVRTALGEVMKAVNEGSNPIVIQSQVQLLKQALGI